MSVSFSLADSSEAGRTFVLWVRGELDATSARTMVHRLAQAERDSRTTVVLDMTGVTAVQPTGLRVLTELTRTVKGLARVKVVAPPDEVAEMFHQAALDEVIELVPPREPEDRRKRQEPVEGDRRTGRERRQLGPDSASS